MAEKNSNAAQSPKRQITKTMIQSKWNFLKHHIVLDDISGYMIQNTVLTPVQIHELNKKNPSERTDEFLYILFTQSDFTGFVTSLEEAGCSYILDVLEGKAECPKMPPVHQTESHLSKDHQESDKNLMDIILRMEKKNDERHGGVTKLLTEMKQTHTDDITRLSDQLTASHDQVLDLRKTISNLEKIIETGKLSKEEIEEELIKRTKECRELKERNQRLQKDFDNAILKTISDGQKEEELEQLQRKVETYKEQIRRMHEYSDATMKEMKRINEELSSVQYEKRQLKEKEAKMLKTIEENQKLTEELENKLNRLKIWKP